jgi:hypothetical protein
MNNTMQSNTRYHGTILLAVLAGLLSTALLSLIIGRHGTYATWDSIVYFNGAINLVHGNGIVQRLYDETTDRIVLSPITHYPPALSMAYAFLLRIGIPLTFVPATLNLICWPVFLGGIGVLTLRLGATPTGAALAVVLAAWTNTYLRVFEHAMSEVLFLPLLVWTMVLLAYPPEPHRFEKWRIGGATVLLALLMLTRYVGIVFPPAVLLWWALWRLYQRQHRRLIWELPLIGLSIVPLALWLLRNQLITDSMLSSHLEQSEFSFLGGVVSAIYQISQILVPAMRPLHEFATLGISWAILNPIFVGMLAFVVVGLTVLGRRLWAMRAQQGENFKPPRSPILLALAAYVSLYIFVQPFAQFYPMDERDFLVVLCLAHPWLLAAITHIWQQRAHALLAGYTVLNLLIIVVPVGLYGIPSVVSLTPPRVQDLYAYPDRASAAIQAGIPQWLIVSSYRTTTLERYYPDVMEFLRTYPRPVVIESNLDDALFYDDIYLLPPARVFKDFKFRTLEDWLENGSCQSQIDTLVIIVDQNYHNRATEPPQPAFAEYAAAVEQKCPTATGIPLEHSIIYQLPTTNGAEAARN